MSSQQNYVWAVKPGNGRMLMRKRELRVIYPQGH